MLFVLGCGKSSNSNDSTKEKSEQFVVWIPGDDVEYSFYYNMFENFKKFKEAQGETFDYVIEQQPWGDYFTKLPLEINNGRGPDMYYVHAAYSDSFLPLSQELDLSQDVLSQLKVTDLYVGPNGKPVFIPTVHTSMIMYANKKIVNDPASYPKSWDELFQKSVQYNNPDKGIIGYDYSFHMLFDLVYQKGGRLTDENGAIFDAEVLQQVVDWANAGFTDYLTYGQGSPEETLYQNSAAYIYGAGWMEFWAPEDAELFAFPVPGFTTSITELTYGISKNVSEEKYAVLNEFVEFMVTDKDTVIDIVKGNSGASNNKIITVEYELGTAGYAVQESYNTGNTLTVVVPRSLEKVYQTMLESALTGVPVEEAVQNAITAAENIDVTALRAMEDRALR